MYRFLTMMICICIHQIVSGMSSNNTITLKDGRTLGYAEYGNKKRFPIFYFHGGQESRLSSKFMDSTAKSLNIRLISPDRHGIGLSTFKENRRFLDWANDTEELANCLGLSRYSIFGLSGGAPHVLTCLQTNTERIVKASIISGATPYNYKNSTKGMWFPVKIIHWFASMKNDWMIRKIIQKDYEELIKNPEKRMKQFQEHLPSPDKELMRRNPEYGKDFITGSLESYNQGIDGVVQEWKLYVDAWDIDLTTIQFPVMLWYGSEDNMAPIQRGFYYRNQLLNSTLKIVENEGHFSLIRNHLEEILNELKPISKK